MNFEDIVFTEDLRISSGEKALDKMFRTYLIQVFSPNFVKKIDRVFTIPLVLRDFRERSNVMAYTQGTKIYVNKPLFFSTPKDKAMNYIMHELIHVLSNTGKFPELVNVNKQLANIVAKAVDKDKISLFFTGKQQNIHSDWRGEAINYLCNNSIDWSAAVIGTKEVYKETLEESGLFDMTSPFWKKRFPVDKK